jgi:hypothetical protein
MVDLPLAYRLPYYEHTFYTIYKIKSDALIDNQVAAEAWLKHFASMLSSSGLGVSRSS